MKWINILICISMSIILLRSNECHFCHDFYPVFKHSQNKMKNYNFLDFNVIFDEDKIKKQFPKIDLSNIGVPTVYIDNKNKLAEIQTVMPKTPLKIKDAYKKFKKNIENGFKTINSKNYTTYTSGNDIEYKIKKYEHKLKEKNIPFIKSDMRNEKTYETLKKLYLKNS
jgi:hypothetical protein